MSLLNTIFIDQIIARPLFGLTTGKLIQLISMVTAAIKLTAFIILIRGLYRLWRLK